jgi:hypothetical protein
MPTVKPTTTLEVLLGGCILGESDLPCVLGGTWTDVTADTRVGVQPIEVSYGIDGTGPNDRIASTGTLQWSLNNNGASNSTGNTGAYSPGHANARDGWDIGVRCRLKLAFGGTDFYKFFGTVNSIVPSAGQYKDKAVACTAVDWMDEAATSKIKGIPIPLTAQRADQLVTTLVEDAVKRQPEQTDYDTTISTFAFAFDNLKDTKTSVLTALRDVVTSELGFLYVKGSTVSPGGVLRLESRHARPLIPTAAYTFDETMVSLDASRAREDLINRIYIVVHPRTVSAATNIVLWELTTTESVPSIPAGETLYITAPFTEASINAYSVGARPTIPLAGTDWIANTAADGSGSVITGDVVMTSENAANAAVLSFVNTGTVTAYLTTVQLRGQTIKDVSETVVSATDEGSKVKFGALDRRLDMKYESDVTLAASAAEWLLNIFASPRYVVKGMGVVGSTSALLTQVLAREPGDRIAVTETMTGLDAVGYFINGVKLHIHPSGLTSVDWTLAPAEQQSAWILNTSLLGIGTTLGYA